MVTESGFSVMVAMVGQGTCVGLVGAHLSGGTALGFELLATAELFGKDKFS